MAKSQMLKAIRGIEKGEGDTYYRIEVGEMESRAALEQEFGKKVVRHYLESGTLVAVKGDADAG